MAWLLLAGAIAAEVTGTIALKVTGGHARLVPWLVPWLVAIAGYGASLVLLSLALRRHMAIGVAYAVWAGVGTALVAAIGMAAFGESLTTVKLLGIVAIIAGCVALNLGGAH